LLSYHNKFVLSSSMSLSIFLFTLPSPLPVESSHLPESVDPLFDGGVGAEEALRSFFRALDGVGDVEVLGRPVGDLEDLGVLRNDLEGLGEALGITGELDRRSIGEVLSLPRHG